VGFRIQKRIKLGNGLGLNISKSGISPSLRTKYGAIGPKGFSIRTGIPGVSYRGGKNSGMTGILFVIFAIGVAIASNWDKISAALQ